MINRILFATDLGLYSPYLMKQLVQIAKSTRAKVDIIHVIEPMGVFAESIINSYLPEEDSRYLRQHGLIKVLSTIKQQVIETLERDYADVLVDMDLGDVLVELGQPAELIIQQGLNQKSDLLVMGSHGQYAFQSGPMGSVVTKVLHVSPIPVMMIPMINLSELDRGSH